jgi:hypothetical protein
MSCVSRIYTPDLQAYIKSPNAVVKNLYQDSGTDKSREGLGQEEGPRGLQKANNNNTTGRKGLKFYDPDLLCSLTKNMKVESQLSLRSNG